MARKVATAHLHVMGGDGSSVTLRPGMVIPAEIADLVTNPDAFVLEAIAEPSSAPTPAPAVDVSEYDVDDFQSLRDAAKARDLSAAGNKAALLERIQAFDAELTK
jgi:hypothetical protein